MPVNVLLLVYISLHLIKDDLNEEKDAGSGP